MRKAGVGAALSEQGCCIVIHLDGGKTSQSVRLAKDSVPWLIKHGAELGVVFRHRSHRAIQCETVRPHHIRRNGEVLLQRGIVYVGGTVHPITKIAIVIAKYGGYFVHAMEIAVTA